MQRNFKDLIFLAGKAEQEWRYNNAAEMYRAAIELTDSPARKQKLAARAKFCTLSALRQDAVEDGEDERAKSFYDRIQTSYI